MKTKNLNQNSKRMMKHFSLFIFLFSFAFAFASCSKSDEAPIAPQSGDQTATFTIAAPATRGEVSGLSRYIVEAYEGNDFATTPQRVEAATGELTLALKKNTVYTFVFWADNGTIGATNNYYDATSLLDVKVNPSAYATLATPAYALATSFNSNEFEAKKAVTLRNATAQINFIDTEGLAQADNSLTVKYSSGGKLNVATGKITEIGSEISRTYINIGMVAQGGTLATDYILAPLGEKRLLDLKVTFNTEAEKTIAAVPFQQSYKTNIKGEFSNFYSSVFTVSNEVEDYTNNEVEFPDNKLKVGSFYYADKSFSNTIDVTKTCIGIVYVVNPDGTTGKIVSLDETTSTKWSAENINTQATSDTDGAANTAKVLALASYTAETYPAFAWCATKNTSVPSGISWYIPAKDELVALYGTKTAVNTSLIAIGATVFSDKWYWSSTQGYDGSAWFVSVSDGDASSDLKDSNLIGIPNFTRTRGWEIKIS